MEQVLTIFYYSHTCSVGVWGNVSSVDMVAERVVLREVPCFATFHVEFLESPKEHDQDKDELSTITPSTWKSNPWIFAHTIAFQLSSAAVTHWEPHVPISTAHVSHNIYLTQFVLIQHIAEREKRGFLAWWLLGWCWGHWSWGDPLSSFFSQWCKPE